MTAMSLFMNTHDVTNYCAMHGYENPSDNENFTKRMASVAVVVAKVFSKSLEECLDGVADLTRTGYKGLKSFTAERMSPERLFLVSKAVNKAASVAAGLFICWHAMAVTASIEIIYDGLEVIESVQESGLSRATLNASIDLLDSTIEAIVIIFASKAILFASLAFTLALSGYESFSEFERGHYIEAIAWVSLAMIKNRAKIFTQSKSILPLKMAS